jgi:hypothetical protein
MTSPQDPNQPGQPTSWGSPPDPNQPGWGAPPAAPQPGWGAPPGYQPAPGWGAPPPPKKKGRGCLIAVIIVVLLPLVVFGSCTALVVVNVLPYATTTAKIQSDLGGPTRATVTFEALNGKTYWLITLKPSYPNSVEYAACNVVGPDLRDSQFKNDGFRIQDSDGNVATQRTPCP